MSRSQKAAIVIVLDVGYSKLIPTDKGEDFLRKSRECASMIIQSKIFSSPKDEVGVILMGQKDPNKGNRSAEKCRNVSILLPLTAPTWDAVRTLESFHSENREEVDWIEAVVAALNHLEVKSLTEKYSERKIVLFTSNLNVGSFRCLPALENGIDVQRVDLYLIYPKVSDDPEMTELMHDVKEAIDIVKKVEGTDIEIEQAIPQLMRFQKKKVKPQAWNICLDIGKQINIAVSGYKMINDGQKLKWEDCLSELARSSMFSVKNEVSTPSTSAKEAPAASTDNKGDRIGRDIIHIGADESKVEWTDVIEGRRFGSSSVPFTAEDKNALKYLCGPKCLSVVKVTKQAFVPRHMWLGNSAYLFVARDSDENAAVAFSAIVQALVEMKSVAIVRRVNINGCKPHIGALFPIKDTDEEQLVFVELPFANDLRQCILPPLKVHHLKKEQLEAIDNLIDGLDLTEENEIRELRPHEVLDPYLQHLRRCVSQRVLNPKEPLPSVDPDLLKMLTEPPQYLEEEYSEALEEVLRLFPGLGENESSQKGRGKRNIPSKNEATEEGDEDDAHEHESTAKIRKEESENKEPAVVGCLTPDEDFKTALKEKTLPVIKVCKQMQEVILNLIRNSFGPADFEKPINSLKLLRHNVIHCEINKRDLILSYNDWMKEVYEELMKIYKMGFWSSVQQEKIAFITDKECPESTLTVAKVNEIVGVNTSIVETESDEDDMDDLN